MTSVGIDLIGEVPAAFLQISEAERPFYSPSLSGELQTGPIETLEARVAVAALTNLILAITKSADAYHQALSWRDFKVGSTAIMTNLEQGTMAYVDGFNVKPDSGKVGLNIHAEQMAISKGRRLGLSRVLVLVFLPNLMTKMPTR